MIQMTECSLCNGNTFGKIFIPGGKHSVKCQTCGLTARAEMEADDARLSWNELCEDIRFGKQARKVIDQPQDAQDALNQMRAAMNGTKLVLEVPHASGDQWLENTYLKHLSLVVATDGKPMILLRHTHLQDASYKRVGSDIIPADEVELELPEVQDVAKRLGVELVDPKEVSYCNQLRLACTEAANRNESTKAAIAGHLMKAVEENQLPFTYVRIAQLTLDHC